MAGTDFARQTPEKKLVWSRRTWTAMRDKQFIGTIAAVGDNSPIHKITELTPTEKGDQCIFHLVADLIEDGVVGDNEREGQEEEMLSYRQIITIDLLSHGVKEKGKMANQKTILSARNLGRDKLSYWLANRSDQLGILSLSGIGYSYNLDGSLRPSRSKLKNLAFAADVRPPSAKRMLNWNGTTLLGAGDAGFGNTNAAFTTTYVPNYKMIVQAGAYMRTHRIKPLTAGNKEYYMMLVHPLTYAALKLDTAFQNALIHGEKRGADNPWFTGADVTVDGMIIKQHNLVFNTLGLPSGQRWGSTGTVHGTRTIVMGAQALAYADLNVGDWNEKTFQYNTQWGINVDKMFGFLVPQFYSAYDQGVEDFGRICIDHHLPQ